MGHYASEMSSSWESSIKDSDRRWKLKKDLEHVPMSYFEAGDMYDLSLLYSVTQADKIPGTRLKRFEEIAKQYKFNKGE